jgi:hypothetical protein
MVAEIASRWFDSIAFLLTADFRYSAPRGRPSALGLPFCTIHTASPLAVTAGALQRHKPCNTVEGNGSRQPQQATGRLRQSTNPVQLHCQTQLGSAQSHALDQLARPRQPLLHEPVCACVERRAQHCKGSSFLCTLPCKQRLDQTSILTPTGNTSLSTSQAICTQVKWHAHP